MGPVFARVDLVCAHGLNYESSDARCFARVIYIGFGTHLASPPLGCWQFMFRSSLLFDASGRPGILVLGGRPSTDWVAPVVTTVVTEWAVMR